MQSKKQVNPSRKPKHRFMLNMQGDLYEWFRLHAFESKTSMSCQINNALREAQQRLIRKKG